MRGYSASPMVSCQSRLELEHLQSIVSCIHRNHAVLFIHRHAPRIGQLARLAPAAAPDFQALTRFLVNQLYAIVAELADDQMSFGIFGQSVRESILSEPLPHRSHTANKGSIGLENIEAMIAGIGDVEDVVIHDHRLRP